MVVAGVLLTAGVWRLGGTKMWLEVVAVHQPTATNVARLVSVAVQSRLASVQFGEVSTVVLWRESVAVRGGRKTPECHVRRERAEYDSSTAMIIDFSIHNLLPLRMLVDFIISVPMNVSRTVTPNVNMTRGICNANSCLGNHIRTE